MEFDKIKVTDKVVTLDYTIRDGHGSAATSFTSNDAPLPSFSAALAAFVPFVMELLDLPSHWQEDLVVTGLSIDREQETKCRGLIVTARRRIGKANGRPVIINTPRMPEANDNTSANIKVLSDAEIELLEAAEAEAERFLNGARDSQPTMMPEKDDEPTLQSENGVSPLAGKAEPPKPRRARKGKDFIPGVGDVANPNATEAPTDGVIRATLIDKGYDVPLETIGKWTSTQRDQAMRFARGETSGVPTFVIADATSTREHQDDWTQPAPPKIDEDGMDAVKAAIEHG